MDVDPCLRTIIEIHDYDSTYLLEVEGLVNIDLGVLKEKLLQSGEEGFIGKKIGRRELNEQIRSIANEAVVFDDDPPPEHQAIVSFAMQQMDWSVRHGVLLYSSWDQKAVAWEYESRVFVVLWETSQ